MRINNKDYKSKSNNNIISLKQSYNDKFNCKITNVSSDINTNNQFKIPNSYRQANQNLIIIQNKDEIELNCDKNIKVIKDDKDTDNIAVLKSINQPINKKYVFKSTIKNTKKKRNDHYDKEYNSSVSIHNDQKIMQNSKFLKNINDNHSINENENKHKNNNHNDNYIDNNSFEENKKENIAYNDLNCDHKNLV